MPPVNYYEKLLQEDLNVGVGLDTKRNPGGGSLSGTQVGLHSFSVGQVKVTTTWNPSSVNSLGTTTTTVTVQGAAVGNFAWASFSLSLGGLLISAEVTAANTVTVTLFNPTTAAVDLASGTLAILVFQSR